jgi:hypothetical protein
MDVKLGAAINIDLTLDQTMSDAKVKLVFLDACRDNPFAAKIRSAKATRSVSVASGLAEMKSGEGTLIAFATGPGQTALDGEAGTNSPFTRALMANIASPGIEIQQAMTKVRAQVNEETSKNQLPWGHTNLIGSVYLNPVAGGNALDQGLQQAGRTQRLSHQLSERHLQADCAGPDRLAAGRPLDRHPQPDHGRRRRPLDLLGRRQSDHRGPAQPRSQPAPRRAAPPDQPRLRHQGFRQVRRQHPRRDHPLAGRPRLSEEWLPQRAAAQGAWPPLPATTPTTNRRASPAVTAVAAAVIPTAAAVAAPAPSSAA